LPDRQPVTQAAIVQFLMKHPGEAFCSRCISEKLFEGRNIDVPIRSLEAHVAMHRRYETCAACRKSRLATSIS
jgi:hypothetical protein